jgi:hypothetical protein
MPKIGVFMNRFFKMSATALFAMCATSVFAEDDLISFQGNREEVVGWTPICVGLATPVQMPFGMNKWDVFGIDINLLYSDAPKVYGLNVGGLAAVTRNNLAGLQVAALANYAVENVYGARVALGINIAKQSVYGLEIGGFALRPEIYGCDIELVGSYQRKIAGVSIAGITNIATEKTLGAAIAVGCNITHTTKGVQIAGIYNHTIELNGCQIALVNYADECVSGFQIGLLNFIMSNQLKVLPFINGYF